MLCAACRLRLSALQGLSNWSRVPQCVVLPGPSRLTTTVRQLSSSRSSSTGLVNATTENLGEEGHEDTGIQEQQAKASGRDASRHHLQYFSELVEPSDEVPAPPKSKQPVVKNAPVPIPIDPFKKVYKAQTFMGRHFNPKPLPNWQIAERLQRVLDEYPLDPAQLLRAIHPALLGDRQVVLDRHSRVISSILSDAYARLPTTPALQNDVSNVLSVLFVRASYLALVEKEPTKKEAAQRSFDYIGHNFATFLIHQAQLAPDMSRLQALFEAVDISLGQYAKKTVKIRNLNPSMTAAVAVLRVKLGITTRPNVEFVWPDGDTVVRALQKIGINSDEYRDGIDSLVAGPPIHGLPGSVADLEAKLGDFVRTGQEKRVISLFEKWVEMKSNRRPKDSEPGDVLDPGVRNEVLVAFVRALRAPMFGDFPPRNIEQLDEASHTAISLITRPIPAPLYHTLLAFRSRLDYTDDSSVKSTGKEITPLAGSGVVPTQDQRRQELLESLHSTWQSAKDDGVVKDVKMYMLYMSGLARYGDLEGMEKAWNELASDEGCKAAYHAEEGDPTASFPPVKMLNHVIAVTLLISRVGPPLALELFEQALEPDSAIQPNVVTINTVLRHHARQADLPAMQSVFVLAERLGIQPDIITFTTLLQGLLRAKQRDIVHNTLDVMKAQGMVPTERMCSVLVADLAHDGDQHGLQHAEELMREMVRVGWKPGVATWTALISGYFRGGWEQDGWNAVRRMEDAHVPLNRVAYNMIMREAGRAAIRQGGEPTAFRLFKQMIAEGHWPNSDSYEIVLRPLVNAKRWTEANAVCDAMEKRKYAPEAPTLRTLVIRCREARARAALL